jgi:hypothetical protein
MIPRSFAVTDNKHWSLEMLELLFAEIRYNGAKVSPQILERRVKPFH